MYEAHIPATHTPRSRRRLTVPSVIWRIFRPSNGQEEPAPSANAGPPPQQNALALPIQPLKLSASLNFRFEDKPTSENDSSTVESLHNVNAERDSQPFTTLLPLPCNP
jgi:hypothetical protein